MNFAHEDKGLRHPPIGTDRPSLCPRGAVAALGPNPVRARPLKLAQGRAAGCRLSYSGDETYAGAQEGSGEAESGRTHDHLSAGKRGAGNPSGADDRAELRPRNGPRRPQGRHPSSLPTLMPRSTTSSSTAGADTLALLDRDH